MPTNWIIYAPASGQQLLLNPSFETNATGWDAASAATVARSSASQYAGAWSLAVTPSSASKDGVSASFTTTTGCSYVFSCFLNGSPAVGYQLYFATTGCALLGSACTFTAPAGGGWARYSACWEESAGGTRRAFVAKNGGTSTAVFYVDAAQVENAASATTFVDGDQDGCSWNGTRHGSQSTRSAQSRAGGTIQDLESVYKLKVRQAIGAGMPHLNTTVLPYGLAPGGMYQRSVAAVRQLTLSVMPNFQPDSASDLHSWRKKLVAAFQPNKVVSQQPMRLTYLGGGCPIDMDVVYTGGLEFGNVTGRVEEIPLSFTAPDPYWKQSGAVGACIPYNIEVANANSIIQRSASGTWGALGSGLSGCTVTLVSVMANDAAGNLIVGGTFVTASGGTACNIALWNGTSWTAITGGATSGADSAVKAIAIGADGTTIYAGGGFANIGGVAATRVACSSGTTWTSLGTGVNNTAQGMAVGASGELYVCGQMTIAGGNTACGIAKWNGSAWSALTGTTCGIAGGGKIGYVVTVGQDANIYLGGDFTAVGGACATYIGKYDTAQASWSGIASGLNNIVGNNDLVFSNDGTLYVGGTFTAAGSAIVSASKIAKLRGTSWSPAGACGANGTVQALAYGPDGTIYAGGNFSKIDGLTPPDKIARFNGSVWYPMDIDLPGTACVFAINVDKNNVITLGYDTSGTASAAAVTSINNPGSDNSYPVISIIGPGTIQQIANMTTGENIGTVITLNSGETATVDLRPYRIGRDGTLSPGKTFTTDFRGNVLGYIIPGSNFSTWHLLPGNNNVSIFITGGTAATAVSIWFKPAHWSLDGGAT